ncbi:MAG TPA: hypothetical protein V6D00_03815 [Pantanalinema sp.]
MNLNSKQALALAGALSLIALAGCTGIPGFGNPQVAPTEEHPMVATKARLIFNKLTFNTRAGSPGFGNHEVYIKNLTDADVDMTNYVLAYHPDGAVSDNVATSSLVFAANDATISAGATKRVIMDLGYTPLVGQARIASNIGVQYSRGGGLGLFDSRIATASANMKDFVQWGRTDTQYAPVAVTAGLWKTGTAIATTSLANVDGVNMTVFSEGATGSTNWNFSTF